MPSIRALLHAPWSLSKIQCALRCPREFHFRYVDKIAEPEVAPEVRLGKAVHAALEAVLMRKPPPIALAAAREALLFDEERARFDQLAGPVAAFADRIEGFRNRRRVRAELVEHRLAVTWDLAPTEFTHPEAFFRGVWDAGFLFDDGVLAVVDHKTGPRREAADYADQLKGYATLAAAHLAYVRRVWLGVHFVTEASMSWAEPIDVPTIRSEYTPRLIAQIEAAAAEISAGGEPRPSGWCKRCSYRSICPAIRAAAAEELPEPEPELIDDTGKEL